MSVLAYFVIFFFFVKSMLIFVYMIQPKTMLFIRALYATLLGFTLYIGYYLSYFMLAITR